MKKIAAICLLLASLHARGDFVVVEKFEVAGDGQVTNDITIRIKGDKARVDVGTGQEVQFSSILDLLTGDRTTLFHEGDDKQFIKMSGAQTKAMLAQLKKQRDAGDDSAAAPKIADTGKNVKVGDYSAEIYTVETPALKFTFWISKEVPNYPALERKLAKAQVMEVELSMGELPDISGIDGVPVKVEVVSKANSRTFTMTLLSVKETPVNDGEFQVPAGYVQGPTGVAPQ